MGEKFVLAAPLLAASPEYQIRSDKHSLSAEKCPGVVYGYGWEQT